MPAPESARRPNRTIDLGPQAKQAKPVSSAERFATATAYVVTTALILLVAATAATGLLWILLKIASSISSLTW